MIEIRARLGNATWNLLPLAAIEFDVLHPMIGLPVFHRLGAEFGAEFGTELKVWPQPKEGVTVYAQQRRDAQVQTGEVTLRLENRKAGQEPQAGDSDHAK